MKFSTIGLKFGMIASKLMGISSVSNSNKVCASGTDVLNGDSVLETIWLVFRNSFLDLLSVIYETIVRIVYMIGHWMLTIIDFIFIFIRQMVGMNSDFTSLEDLSNSDMIFQFVFNDTVLRIMRGMLALGIVLLILFCIFAIIKSEYEFITQNSSNSKRGILISTAKALFLMAFVPVVAIGGIIMSNAILRSLYVATSRGETSLSIGSQIFVASTYSANAYRRYADRNLKIPITFNFSEIKDTDNVYEYDTSGTIKEMDEALKDFKGQSVWTRGYKTFLMFESNGFLEMDNVDSLDRVYDKRGEKSPYHDVYDDGLFTRREQYYIMADVVEYSVMKNKAVYFKSAQEVYESFFEVYEILPDSSKNIMESYLPITKNEEEGVYNFSVHYRGDSETTQYSHKKNAHDEAQDAVFIIAVEKHIEFEGKTYSYFYPLLNGQDGFATDYYQVTSQPVIAKGMFEDGEHPTAIREKDGIIEFYRDDMNIPMLADFFPKISYEMPEGAFESLGIKILKGTFSALTGVDPSQFIPYVYFSVDIFNLFTKTTNAIVKLDGGLMKVDYNFSSRQFDQANVYKFSDINLIIFIFASVLMIGILLKVLFGIAFRTLDIFLLILTYPAVLFTLPLDGSRFKSWTKTFVQKLISIYAVVIGINIILILVPITSGVDLFTVAEIEQAIGLGQLGSSVTADFLNMFFHFFMLLVALSSIDGFIKTLASFVGSGSENPVSEGSTVVNDLKELPKKVGNVVSGKVFIDAGKEAVATATALALPGSAIAGEAVKSVANFVGHKKSKNDHGKSMLDRFQNIGNTVDAGKNGKYSSDGSTSEEANYDLENNENNSQESNSGASGNNSQDLSVNLNPSSYSTETDVQNNANTNNFLGESGSVSGGVGTVVETVKNASESQKSSNDSSNIIDTSYGNDADPSNEFNDDQNGGGQNPGVNNSQSGAQEASDSDETRNSSKSEDAT